MELNNSILGINTQDPIINDVFKNDIQYTHITGSVNLCVNRCGQEIDNCNEIHLMNMVNNGKILILNQNPEKSKNNKCKLKKAYDDDVVGEEFSSYHFEKMFVITSSFHKIDGILYDCELGFIFSKIDANGKKKYIVLCVLANSASDSRTETLSKSGDLLFYKLTNELFKDVPNFSNKKEITYGPNPIDLSNFFPPYGERSFYEYTYKNIPHISYRIFQRPMIISNSALGNLREKLVPNKLYNQYKEALQAYENPKRNLLIFFKEDTDKPIIESLENQETSQISDLNKAFNEDEKDNKENNNKEDDNLNIENYETDFNNIDENKDDANNVNKDDEKEDDEKEDDEKKDNEKKDDKKEEKEKYENDNIDEKSINENDIDENDLIENVTIYDEKKKNVKEVNKITTPIRNSMMKMYIITILVIVFQLSNQVFMSNIINKQTSGYKPDAELMNYIYSKTPFATNIYFLNKSLNIISVLLLAILYVVLVVKGTFNNFNDSIIGKDKSFRDILITIVIFLFISIITNFMSTLSRLLLPSEKYGEISCIDSFLNIDSIILYFTSNKSVSSDCFKDENYKLSELFSNEEEESLKKFQQIGGAPNNDSSISNLYENLQYIMGTGLTQNVSKITSFIMYFVYIFVVFVVLFNQFESSYALSKSNEKIYNQIYKSFIGSYIIMFIIFGILFIAAFGISITKVMRELDHSLSIMKKLESLFRNPLFIIMFIIWFILLIFVIAFGAAPKLKGLKGSKTFVIVGIFMIILLFLMVVFFLFEPIRRLGVSIMGIQEDLSDAPEWFKSIFKKKQEIQEEKTLNNIIRENEARGLKRISEVPLDPFEKKSLKDRGTDAHLLRGLLGGIGVDSDLLHLVETNPMSDKEKEELERIVIDGLASREKRTKIIEKLKEIHNKEYKIEETKTSI